MKTAACGHNEKTWKSRKTNNGNQESETITVPSAPESQSDKLWLEMSNAPEQSYWSAPEQHTDAVPPLYQCHDLPVSPYSYFTLEESLWLKWGPLGQQQKNWIQRSSLEHNKQSDIWAPICFFFLVNELGYFIHYYRHLYIYGLLSWVQPVHNSSHLLHLNSEIS